MQRREQQKRAAGGGGGSSSYLSSSGYSAVPRFEPTPVTPQRTESPVPSSLRPPAFKGSGMKLGSKKKTGADLADLLGGEADEPSAPSTPLAPEPEPVVENIVQLPAVVHER